MSTTSLPSTSPSVLNVGPGPSDTYGTVTRPSSTPNATTGASATNSVTTRLFTTPTVRVCAANPFTDSVTLRPRRPRPMSTVMVWLTCLSASPPETTPTATSPERIHTPATPA